MMSTKYCKLSSKRAKMNTRDQNGKIFGATVNLSNLIPLERKIANKRNLA